MTKKVKINQEKEEMIKQRIEKRINEEKKKRRRWGEREKREKRRRREGEENRWKRERERERERELREVSAGELLPHREAVCLFTLPTEC